MEDQEPNPVVDAIFTEMARLSEEWKGVPLTFQQVVAATAFWTRVFLDGWGGDEEAQEFLVKLIQSTHTQSVKVPSATLLNPKGRQDN